MGDWKQGPCRNCEARHISCHADCAAYLEWKANYNAVQDRIKDIKKKQSLSFLDTPYRHKLNKKER